MTNWERVFADLVEARGSALLRYAYLLCGHAGDAADLTQEGLLRAFSRARAGGDMERLESYVRRAILNVYLDDRRRRGRWRAARHLLAIGEADEAPDQAIAEADRVRTALDGLSPRQRACIVLRFWEDLPVAEIASDLNCSEGTVKRHLSEAIARLGSTLDISMEELDA